MDLTKEPARHRRTWFLFVQEVQSGPLSRDEIFRKLDEGQIDRHTYAWTDGMEDWSPLGEIPAFGLPGSEKFARQSVAARLPPTAEMPVRAATAATPTRPAPARRRLRFAQRPGALAVGLLAALVIARFFAGSSSADSPYRLPELPDVAPDEFAALRAAAAAPRERMQVAAAISRVASTTPSIYVAANQADGSAFEVVIQGVPETLLGKTRVFRRAVVETKRGLAQTPPFRDYDGAALPPGEYRVYVLPQAARASAPSVSEAELAANLRMSAALRTGAAGATPARAYFLGGPRDEAYDRRLQAFHEKVREQARLERQELDEYAATLAKQLTASSAAFARIVAQSEGAPAAGPQWDRFAGTWRALQAQITASVEVWREANLRDEYFYADLYLRAKQLALQVEQVHTLHEKIVMARDRREPASPKQAEAERVQAARAIASLQERVARAAQLPLTANGMPQRETEF